MENSTDSTNQLDFSSDRIDLSDLIARIDIACLCLDFFEPGLWWDWQKHRRAIAHPSFLQWMALYKFSSLAMLPPAALISLCSQLERRVNFLNSPAPLALLMPAVDSPSSPPQA